MIVEIAIPDLPEWLPRLHTKVRFASSLDCLSLHPVTFKDCSDWASNNVLGCATQIAEVVGNIYENPELFN